MHRNTLSSRACVSTPYGQNHNLACKPVLQGCKYLFLLDSLMRTSVPTSYVVLQENEHCLNWQLLRLDTTFLLRFSKFGYNIGLGRFRCL